MREREVGAMGLTQQFSILNYINEDCDCRIILITAMITSTKTTTVD